MGTSNPFRPQGIRAADRAGNGPASVHLVTVSLGGDALPLLEMQGGKAVPTAAGRAVSEAWRTLGTGRSGIGTDAFALEARALRGILRITSGDPADLSSAIRLFKAEAARAVRAARRDAAGAESGTAGMWKRGYAEKPLGTPKQVAAARKSLDR